MWPSGYTLGALGWPRLEQRVAFCAWRPFERGLREMTGAVDLSDVSRVDVLFEFLYLAKLEPRASPRRFAPARFISPSRRRKRRWPESGRKAGSTAA